LAWSGVERNPIDPTPSIGLEGEAQYLMKIALKAAAAFAAVCFVWPVCLLAALPATADRPAPNVQLYQNSDYQFSVKLPHGYLACVGEITNHGVVMLLDHNAHCDGPYDNVRHIDVNADYNAAGDADTAWGLAEIECRWQGARHIVWLLGASISGRKAAGCRRSFADGHIEVTYIVLRKTDHSALTWIEVSADLITTPARYAADMRVFRRVLPGIWVHPDGPHY
jgi:hypothetical protein